MSRRRVIEKVIYRFTVVDDTIHTWGILDRSSGIIVEGEFRSPQEARERAEYLNFHPEVIDDQNADNNHEDPA